ncbi:MAG: hypothetical protein ACNA7V_11505 [Bacteroidales bacterium]
MKTKRFLLFFAIATLIAGCKNAELKMDAESESIGLTVTEFKQRAEEFAGETVIVKGLVNHACRHSGKRMFIVDPETSEGLRVDAGKIVAGFDNSLEGSMVLVTGVVMEKRIDEAYLDEWEAEVHEECAAEQAYNEAELANVESGEESEEQENDSSEDLERISRLRQQVLESEKGYISFFHLECTSYEVIEENTGDEKAETKTEDGLEDIDAEDIPE